MLGAQLAARPALELFEEDQRLLLGFPAASLHGCHPWSRQPRPSRLARAPSKRGADIILGEGRDPPGRNAGIADEGAELGHDRKRAVAGQLAVELVRIVDARMAVNANLVRSEEWNS